LSFFPLIGAPSTVSSTAATAAIAPAAGISPVGFGAMEISALALRAGDRTAAAVWNLPFIPASGTFEFSLISHLYNTSFDSESLAQNQRLGDFQVRGLDNPPECRARYIHLLSRIFLI
jgi:hypothetical protein